MKIFDALTLHACLAVAEDNCVVIYQIREFGAAWHVTVPCVQRGYCPDLTDNDARFLWAEIVPITDRNGNEPCVCNQAGNAMPIYRCKPQ